MSNMDQEYSDKLIDNESEDSSIDFYDLLPSPEFEVLLKDKLYYEYKMRSTNNII